MVNSINSNYRELPQQHRQDAPPIPTEDLQNDPHEMKNLYDYPKYEKVPVTKGCWVGCNGQEWIFRSRKNFRMNRIKPIKTRNNKMSEK